MQWEEGGEKPRGKAGERAKKVNMHDENVTFYILRKGGKKFSKGGGEGKKRRKKRRGGGMRMGGKRNLLSLTFIYTLSFNINWN